MHRYIKLKDHKERPVVVSPDAVLLLEFVGGNTIISLFSGRTIEVRESLEDTCAMLGIKTEPGLR